MEADLTPPATILGIYLLKNTVPNNGNLWTLGRFSMRENSVLTLEKCLNTSSLKFLLVIGNNSSNNSSTSYSEMQDNLKDQKLKVVRFTVLISFWS